MKRIVLAVGIIVVLVAAGFAYATLKHRHGPAGVKLTSDQAATVQSAFDLMHQRGLDQYADLGRQLYASGQWLAASPKDQYLAASEKAGDTPFAYTLPDDQHNNKPIAIVLAPRFFAETTPKARAALMIHEMGHWLAFVHTHQSTEYDGYKTEFDTHKKLGLTEADGLTYFMLLDGVTQYVVPRDKSYANQPEVKSYASNAN